MKTLRTMAWGVGCIALLLGATACAKKSKPVTERDRKEAALVVTEAQFAVTMRDWPRAEALLDKAVQLSPEADYLMALASTRVRMGNRGGAKAAYERALRAFEDLAALDATRADPWVSQVTVLALMRRIDDSKAVLAKAAKRFPNDPRIRALQEPKNFEQMLNDPKFKENAL